MAHLAVPADERKVAFHSRRPQIHRGFKIGPVQRIVADGWNTAVGAEQVRCLADGICSLTQRSFGHHVPAASRQRQGEVRIEIDAAGVARMEAGPDGGASGRGWLSGIGAGQIAERRSHPPIKRRGVQRPVQHIEAQARQVKNPRLIGVDRGRIGHRGSRGAGEGLEPVQRDGGNKSAMSIGERHVTLYLGTDRLPVVVVEDQPVDVAGEVFDVARQVR